MSTDPLAEWQQAHERVCDLVLAADDAAMDRPVPATPDWSARDLLSHMVGLGADVLAGDEPDDHNERWTRAQVEARRDRSTADLVAEWRALAPDLVGWMRENGPRPLGDVVIHEQDLRGALGVPGARDTAGLAAVRERMAGRVADAAGDLPPLLLDGGSWTHVTSGDPAEAVTVVRADGFDLFRALTSRRTADQLRAWTVRGDVAPYLDAFAALGPLPERPLAGE
ncbi:maleylpyruvate isomerase N-terminal domain-containing protein [Phycicoccus flavus]|uniref:maleylpyruvate isomerase N-terminal domain-containing protein n=1 Tax=Phycicoccus flavus TaxID=2502783 RepID=UPI00197BB43F|nr:maleylpyruvate isomerase N-terminal domain-containing protein [Phycicoccus flavus]